MGRVICLIMVLCLPAAEAATYYKWVDKDGSIVYSDEPPQGVEAKEVVIPDRPSVAPKSFSTPRRSQTQADRAADLSRQIDERAVRRNQLQKQLEAAKKALVEAERAKELGQAPLPGERLANAGGGTRLGPAYFKRQKKLEAAIQKAREQVEALRRELRQLSR